MIGKINKSINQLSLRERVLLVLTIASVVSMLLDVVFLKPLEDKRRAVRGKNTSFQQQMQEITQRLATIGGASEKSGDLARVGNLKAEEKRLSEQLSHYRERLPQAQDSVELIGQFAQPEMSSVSVVALRNIAPTAMRASTEKKADDKGVRQSRVGRSAEASSGWYRHGVVVKAQGPQSDLMGYLRSLEQASKQMAWESLYFEQNDNRRAKLTFEAYTVSDQPFWLQIN